MKKILVLTQYYEPFVKGGGPIQSIKNIVNNLQDKFSFKVVTNDRDLGDVSTFEDLKTDSWVKVNNATVYYTNINRKKVIKILKETEYDIAYLNSFFSFSLSILPVLLHRFRIIKDKKIVLAPRGEFSEGALSLKSTKKRIYIWFSNLIGLYRNVRWHATAESEQNDILNCFKGAKNIMIASNLTEDYSNLSFKKVKPKRVGMVNLVFISRIHPKKNLKFALELLNTLNGSVNFKIYGPIEDEVYWAECKNIIDKLSNNIVVSYEGILNHGDIISKLEHNHVFLFPTLGENFGHVISEALVGGCPVIISDQTPWVDLEEYGVGFDIPLNNMSKFNEAIQYYIDMDNDKYMRLAKNAFEYGVNMSNKEDDLQKSYKLFEY